MLSGRDIIILRSARHCLLIVSKELLLLDCAYEVDKVIFGELCALIHVWVEELVKSVRIHEIGITLLLKKLLHYGEDGLLLFSVKHVDINLFR